MTYAVSGLVSFEAAVITSHNMHIPVTVFCGKALVETLNENLIKIELSKYENVKTFRGFLGSLCLVSKTIAIKTTTTKPPLILSAVDLLKALEILMCWSWQTFLYSSIYPVVGSSSSMWSISEI